MAFRKIEQPAVKIEQVQINQSIEISNPVLVPFIAGVCREIIDAFDSTGAWNTKSKYGSYAQLPLSIPYLLFPSPRANISEVTVESSYIKGFFDFASSITELSTTSNFLTSYNNATRACVRSDTEPVGGWDLNPIAGAKTLILAVDQTVPSLTTKDVSITFTSTANAKLTTAQVVDQINTAIGKAIASSVTLTNEAAPRLQLCSLTYGAASSITIRGGGSANTVLGFQAQTERVEGSGFRGNDDQNGDTRTPFIEWYRGTYTLNAVEAAFPVGSKYGQIQEDSTFLNSKTSAVTFDTNGIDIKVGDNFWADGIKVKDALITKVEVNRFKLGTINTQLSTYDAAGKIITPVYDLAQVAIMTDPVPFAPRNSWFKANNLTASSLATAAKLTGDKAGTAAETANIMGSALGAGPYALSGLSLKVTVTEDGVEKPEVTFSFASNPADLTAVVAAIGNNIPGVVASVSGGNKLKLDTVKTGATQAIKLNKNSTANTILGFSTGSDTTDTGKDVEFLARTASVATSGNAFPLTLANGNTLVIKLSSDGGATYPTTKTHTSAGATYNTIDDLVTALTNDANVTGGNLVTISKTGNELVITTVATGDATMIKIDATSTGIGTNKIKFTSDQTGRGADALTGLTLEFQLNYRSTKTYSITFQSNSLVDANTLINEAVGATIGSISTLYMVLTSTLKGYASHIKILQSAAGLKAARTLGFLPSNDVAKGIGRPFPELIIDDVNKKIIVDAELLRNIITGNPYDPALTNLYIQYRGIRKDISPLAKNPLILRLGSEEELETVLGPFVPENELALNVRTAMRNAPNIMISCMGVDEISSTHPQGTLAAYQRILDFIAAQDPYVLAPLSLNDDVKSAFVQHIVEYNKPENGTERVLFICETIPTRGIDTLIGSGVGANSVLGQTNILNVDVNTTTALLQKGINTNQAIPYSAQLFIRLKVGGATRNYNISNVNGVVLTLRTTFGALENTDAFYSTTTLTESVIDAEWGIYIRGAELVLPGTTLPDKQAIAENIYLKIQNNYNPMYNQKYQGRSICCLVGDKCKMNIDGTVLALPLYYVASAYVGLTAYEAPQQPFTNYKLVGFEGVTKTYGYFKKEQLDLIAGGGGWIMIADKDGLPIYSRHQLTTDTSTIETREFSIKKALDSLAKLVRDRYRSFIGNRNIDSNVLNDLGFQNKAIRDYLVNEKKMFKDVQFKNLVQLKDKPDQLSVDVTVITLYPLNRINVRIYF